MIKIWWHYLITIFCLPYGLLVFELNCPNLSHRPFRASAFCGVNSSHEYTCLFDTNKNQPHEFCEEPDYTAAGEYYVFSGKRRNVLCEKNYQPIRSWSNESSKCLYHKSKCNGEGQLLFNNGSNTEDTACQCDFLNGYEFVKRPKHDCYCIPSEEDCSCFKCDQTMSETGRRLCTIGGQDFGYHLSCVTVLSDKGHEDAHKKGDMSNSESGDKKLNIQTDSPGITGKIWATGSIAVTILFAVIAVSLIYIYEFTDPEDDTIKLVVGTDIGTTYTGFASLTSESFRDNPQDIRINPFWHTGIQSYCTPKTPTDVLFKKVGNRDMQFIAFGYEAKNKYADILSEKDSENFFFFRNFKMCLYKEQDISEKTVIKDQRGRDAPAKKVFSEVLRYLISKIKKTYPQIPIGNIRWILTVPAIWSDKAKEFMRSCGEEAGMMKDNVTTLTESEAVSVYFRYRGRRFLSDDAISDTSDADMSNSRYIVVDIGGGTVDITAHATSCGKLNEMCMSRSIPLGGTTIDKSFEGIFRNIVGNDVMKTVMEKHNKMYTVLMQEFEKFKETSFTPDENRRKFSIKLELLNEICKTKTGRTFSELLRESDHESLFSTENCQLVFNSSIFVFDILSTVKDIIKRIKEVISEINPIDLQSIFVVGGFSMSPIVRQNLAKAIDIDKLIVPSDPGDANLAVVKGATLFGHTPEIINSRITQYTYGLAKIMPFDKALHRPSKMVNIDGRDLSVDIFDTLIKKNTSVQYGHKVERKKVVQKDYSSLRFSLYKTVKDDILYVDEDGCDKFCEFVLDLPVPCAEERNVTLRFEFGNTELTMSAIDDKTKNLLETSHVYCK